jgi:hypothetical protein
MKESRKKTNKPKPKAGDVEIGQISTSGANSPAFGSMSGDVTFDQRNQTRQMVNTGGGAYIGGNVSVGGGTFIGRDQINISQRSGLDADEVAKLFAAVYQQVDRSPQVDEYMRPLVAEQVRQIETIVKADMPEAKKQAELEPFAMRLAKMAPDILEVVLTTLANPIIGLTTVAQKIRQRVQQGG